MANRPESNSLYGSSQRPAIQILAIDSQNGGKVYLPQREKDAPLHGDYHSAPQQDLSPGEIPEDIARSLLPKNFEHGEIALAGTWVTLPYTPHRRTVVVTVVMGQQKKTPPSDEANWHHPEALLEQWRLGTCNLDLGTQVLLKALIAHPESPLRALKLALREHGSTALQTRPLEVRPGIRLLPLLTPTLPPATHTNCYILGHKELLLVDPASPYPDEQGHLDEVLETLVRDGAQIKAVLLTHHHGDHIAGAEPIHKKWGVPIWAHAVTKQRLANTVPIHRLINDGEEITLGDMNFKAYHTPGHAPGHLCLFESKLKTLIAGDMVAGWGSIVVEPRDGDLGEYLEQLERLAQLHPNMALPAHGPALANGRSVLLGFRAHRLKREAQIVDTLKKRPMDAQTLTQEVYHHVPEHILPLARASIDAHIIKLMKESRVSCTVNGDLKLIQPPNTRANSPM